MCPSAGISWTPGSRAASSAVSSVDASSTRITSKRSRSRVWRRSAAKRLGRSRAPLWTQTTTDTSGTLVIMVAIFRMNAAPATFLSHTSFAAVATLLS